MDARLHHLAGHLSDCFGVTGPTRVRFCALAALLGEAALAPDGGTPPRRAPSLHHDGTPLQLSVSLQPRGRGGARMTFEPGGLHLSTSAQIQLTDTLLRRVLAREGWTACTAPLDALLLQSLPADLLARDALWGGLWVGMAAHPTALGLRIYANQRWDTPLARWQRLGAILRALSPGPMPAVLRDILLSAVPVAVPVGLGLDLVAGQARALKLYAAMPSPSASTLQAALPSAIPAAHRAALLAHLPATLPAQSVTLCYDIALGPDHLPGPLTRVKVDLDAIRILSSDRAARLLVDHLAAATDLSTRDLDLLLRETPTPLRGRRLQYIGLGMPCGDRPPHLNVYVRPGGFHAAAAAA